MDVNGMMVITGNILRKLNEVFTDIFSLMRTFDSSMLFRTFRIDMNLILLGIWANDDFVFSNHCYTLHVNCLLLNTLKTPQLSRCPDHQHYNRSDYM